MVIQPQGETASEVNGERLREINAIEVLRVWRSMDGGILVSFEGVYRAIEVLFCHLKHHHLMCIK